MGWKYNFSVLFFLFVIGLSKFSNAKELLSDRTPSSIEQTIDAETFFTCIKKTVEGNVEGKCSLNRESNACIGITKALENSQKNTRCFQLKNQICLTPGHLQNTQMQWLSTTAGHLAIFHSCIHARYGDGPKGAQAALNDPALEELLQKINDGSSTLGLENGSILRKTLEGISLGKVITTSPWAQNIPEKDLPAIQDNANNPIAIDHDYLTASSENSESLKLYSSPWNTWRDTYLQAYPSPGAKSYIFNKKKKNPTTLFPKNSGAPEKTSLKNLRSYELNPYRIDSEYSLFDRISIKHRMLEPQLRVMEEWIPQATEPVKDVKGIIQKGATLKF